jgi:hypothetical protein
MVRSLGLGLLLIAAPLVGAQLRNPLKVMFGVQSLSIYGVAPGGSLVLFGVAREPLSNRTPVVPAVVIRAEILEDEDRDGIVQLDLPGKVPVMGMWSAVDLSTGANLLFPSPGFQPRRIAIGPELVRADEAGDLRKIEWPFGQMDVLVVRPGWGAWRQFAAKTSAQDENRSNGTISLRIDASDMTPIGDSAPGPGAMQPGDIVAIFDRHEMQYGILEVGR